MKKKSFKKITKLKMLTLSITLLILFLVLFLIFQVFGLKIGKMPDSIGVNNEELSVCPQKDNCISSFEKERSKYYFPPLSNQELKVTPKTLKSTIETLASSKKISSFKLISETENYLHFEFYSNFFNFVDDLEVLFKDQKVYFRSAARVGYSDLGVNKKRLETISQELSRL